MAGLKWQLNNSDRWRMSFISDCNKTLSGTQKYLYIKAEFLLDIAQTTQRCTARNMDKMAKINDKDIKERQIAKRKFSKYW